MKQFNLFILVFYVLSSFHSGVKTQEQLELYNDRFAILRTTCKNETGSWIDEDGCNWCSCNDGQPMCTMMKCDNYDYNNHNLKKMRGNVQKSTSTHMCKQERGSWLDEDGCNRCGCMDGVKACTRMFCMNYEYPGYKKLKMAGQKSTSTHMCKQERGSWLDEDGCNRCGCIDGVKACTHMLCMNYEYPTHKKLKSADGGYKCKQDTETWLHPDGCNTCSCVAGMPVCTLMKCVFASDLTNKCKKETGKWLDRDRHGCRLCECKGGIPSCKSTNCKKKTDAIPAICKKFSGRWKTKDGCRWCFCDQGQIICTAKKTNKTTCKNKKKLVPGANICKDNVQRQFKIAGCNWCYCIDSVTPICTQMDCYRPAPGMKLKHIPKTEPNVCEAPGRAPGRFLHEDGCNWCYCIGSKVPMCTIIGCPKQLSQTELSKKKLHVLQTFNGNGLA